MKPTESSRTSMSIFAASLIALFLSMAISSSAAKDPGAICATSKQKAAAKKLTEKVKCHGKAIKKGVPVDAACLTKAEGKFDASFTKAEGKGGCVTTGDTAAIEMLIDETLADLLEALPASASTSTTTTTLP